MDNSIPLRYAFIAPALFGGSLFVAGLATLALGATDDIAHAISSVIVLMVMVSLYRSAGFRNKPSRRVRCACSVFRHQRRSPAAGRLHRHYRLALQGRYRHHGRHHAPLSAPACRYRSARRGLCFRGVSLAVLEQRGLPFWAANLIQAALFAAFHFNIVQSAYAFACALVLGGLRQRDGIGSSVVAHCTCNLSGVILGLALAASA